MNASAGMDLIRSFFSSIDTAIYSLISILYRLLLQLARTSIFTTTDIENFASRVYIFLGIIMLFKVTFSLINYLVNPDAITDKTNGAGNVIKNIVITLFLIIIVPYAFDFLYNAQSAILNDNLIPRLILGTTDGNTDSQSIVIDSKICLTDDGQNYKTSVIEDVGDYIALVTFKPFFQSYNDNSVNYQNSSEVSSGTINSFCNSSTVKQMLKFHNADTAAFNTGKYVFDYSFLLSTLTGILVLLLLIEFCFDVAMRCVKLGFLEIIAPIPIISYIDPNSGKNGMFKKWTKEVINTWARLFIRLAILFFAVYAITIINNNLGTVANSENGMWIMLFLVIGALLFAKKAVQLIEDILGIKLDHSIQLNPFKKISDQALGGKMIASLPGKTLSAGVGLGVSGVSNIIANRKKSGDFKQKQNDYNIQKTKLDIMNSLRARQQSNLESSRSQVEKYQRDLDSANVEIQNKMATGTVTAADWQKRADLQQKLNYYESEAQKSSKFIDSIKTQEIEVEKAKTLMETVETSNDVFSYNHQMASTIISALRGAKLGFTDKEAENLGKAIAAGINAAKRTAKIRNDRDKFSFADSLHDLGSDLLGIKNQSGTTHEISGRIKELQENLTKIENGISMMNHELSMKNSQSLKFDGNGNISINENYNFAPGERENVQYTIDQYNRLLKARKDTSKEIKEYQEIKDLSDKRRNPGK